MNRIPEKPLQVTRRGVVAVCRQDSRWLLIQRAQDVAAPGAWCFPGGTVEPGETEEAALVRELYEELNLRVQPLRRVWQWSKNDNSLSLAWWTANILKGPIRPNPAEVAQACWLSLAQVRALPDVLPHNLKYLELFARIHANLND